MRIIQRLFCGVVIASLLGSQSLAPAVIKEESKQPTTMIEWVKAHPDATLEYTYPSMKASTGTKHLLAEATTLNNGTPVVIRILDSISSETSTSGGSISFQVVSDIKQDGELLIKAGEMGTAQVTVADDRGMIGQPGKITVSDFGVKAVDGSYVPLRATLTDEGKDRMVLSIVVSLLFCPLFLLMKGGEGEIPSGTQKTVYVAADIDVAS